MTWSDFETPKGFHTFDYDTRKLEFIPNPNKLFVRLIYRGSEMEADQYEVQDAYCKVVVKDKGDPYQFDKFIQKLEQQNPADLKIVEPLTQDANDVIISEAETTEAILDKHIDMMDIEQRQKYELNKLMNRLYRQALEIERNA